MKNYQREYPLFSLCGLNCALCPMHLNKYCPGCGALRQGEARFCAVCGQPFASEEAKSEDARKPETFRREMPKVGRNDPCPCGSGKKYKNCCMNKDLEQ